MGAEITGRNSVWTDPNKGSPLYDLPDWKYADGTPGIPSFHSIKRMTEDRQHAQQIKDALEFIKASKDSVNEHYAKLQKKQEYVDKSLFKHKGQRKMSDLK